MSTGRTMSDIEVSIYMYEQAEAERRAAATAKLKRICRAIRKDPNEAYVHQFEGGWNAALDMLESKWTE